MIWRDKLRLLVLILLSLLAFSSISILLVSGSTAANYRLYELFGVAFGTIIPVYGIWKMKILTDDDIDDSVRLFNI